MPAGAGSGLKASDFVTSKHRVSSHDLPPPRHPHQVGQGPHQKPAHIIYAPRYPCTSLSVHLQRPFPASPRCACPSRAGPGFRTPLLSDLFRVDSATWPHVAAPHLSWEEAGAGRGRSEHTGA